MKDYTHICIVLDASSSMADIESDTKESFNSFIKEQKEAEGKTVLDLYQFSDKVKRIVEHVDLATFQDDLMAKYRCSTLIRTPGTVPMFQDDLMAKYWCSECTVLNDAVCTAIDTLGKEFALMKESERPEHVMFVIITNGMENTITSVIENTIK